jgi:hypothetical protein
MIKFVLVRSDVFPDTLVTSTNKFVRQDIADMLLKVAFIKTWLKIQKGNQKNRQNNGQKENRIIEMKLFCVNE